MQLMSIDDLAAYLGDSKRTIYKYIASGDCPPFMRISSKNIKFDRADVDAWLESKKVFPGKEGKKMSEISFVDLLDGQDLKIDYFFLKDWRKGRRFKGKYHSDLLVHFHLDVVK